MDLNGKHIYYFSIQTHWKYTKTWSGHHGYCIAEGIDQARDRIRKKYFQTSDCIDDIRFWRLKEVEIDEYGIFI